MLSVLGVIWKQAESVTDECLQQLANGELTSLLQAGAVCQLTCLRRDFSSRLSK